jgi:NAD(P)-dependent dehydrogenase (short-subunit alcohol dehydrogenase family)
MTADTDLTGQVALVTGSARGIGQAIARMLARRGADVGLLDIGSLDNAVAAVRAEGQEAWPLHVDLAIRPKVREAVAGFAEARGRLDILVNNAGVMSGTPLLELTDEEFDRLMAINAAAMVATVQAAWPAMRQQGRGRIVLIGSRAAQAPTEASPAYIASKAAVHGLVIAFAVAGGPHDILCNGVAPGPTQTDMAIGFEQMHLPLGHMGSPDDIAAAVAFLASPANNYINGTVLRVNGGLLMG